MHLNVIYLYLYLTNQTNFNSYIVIDLMLFLEN